jgi:hypothetical protein
MFTMYFIHQILTNIINTEVYFVGYLYILGSINARKMEHKKLSGVLIWTNY